MTQELEFCRLCNNTGRIVVVTQLADGSKEQEVIPCDCFFELHGIEDSTGDE